MSGNLAQLRGVSSIQVPAEPAVKTICPCDFRCPFVEWAFVGSGDYESDKASFLFTKVSVVDSIEFKIIKNGVVKATVSDDSYGAYYSTFTAQPLYSGFIADWALISAAFGYGHYQIRASLTIIGTSYDIDSHVYHVVPFNLRFAHNTVKVESYQTGQIVSGFDFRGLVDGGWYSSLRVPATMVMQGSMESDRYFDSQYRLIQNRDRVIRTFNVNMRLIPDQIHDHFVGFVSLANYNRLSAYDAYSEQEWRNIEVVCENIGDFDSKSNGFGVFSMEFKDRRENIIKRNVS